MNPLLIRAICVLCCLCQMHGYVYDEKYPIVFSSDSILPKSKNIPLKTDHFGYNLDLARHSNARTLWVGAPKGSALRGSSDIYGSLYMCTELDALSPSCDALPDNEAVGGEDFSDQLFGITVKTVQSTEQAAEVKCYY